MVRKHHSLALRRVPHRAAARVNRSTPSASAIASRPAGIVAVSASFLHGREANIVAGDRCSTSPEHGPFFQTGRVSPARPRPRRFAAAFAAVAAASAMDWRLAGAAAHNGVPLLASRRATAWPNRAWPFL
jgi:formyltetrahydrofolate hydrolase